MSAISNELEEMALQVQNYESMVKIKDQQLNTLSKMMIKGMVNNSVSSTDKDVKQLKELEKGNFYLLYQNLDELALELSRTQRFNSELDKINTQLHQKVKQQTELLTQLGIPLLFDYLFQ